MIARRAAWVPLLALFALTGEARGQAQPPPGIQRCAAAYEEGQRRQAKGQLLDARREASVCAAASCPAEIVGYCAKLVDDLDAAIPTVVVAAVDERGRDVPGVRVSVDGRDAGLVDGRPLRIDPGAHQLRGVPPPGGPEPATVDVTVRTGERNRRVQLQLVAVHEEPAPAASPGIGYAPAAIAFAVGAAGVIVGATTGILALRQNSDLEEVCPAGACAPAHAAEIDRLHTLSRISTGAFVVGGVGIAAGVVLAILAKRGSRTVRTGDAVPIVRF